MERDEGDQQHAGDYGISSRNRVRKSESADQHRPCGCCAHTIPHRFTATPGTVTLIYLHPLHIHLSSQHSSCLVPNRSGARDGVGGGQGGAVQALPCGPGAAPCPLFVGFLGRFQGFLLVVDSKVLRDISPTCMALSSTLTIWPQRALTIWPQREPHNTTTTTDRTHPPQPPPHWSALAFNCMCVSIYMFWHLVHSDTAPDHPQPQSCVTCVMSPQEMRGFEGNFRQWLHAQDSQRFQEVRLSIVWFPVEGLWCGALRVQARVLRG